MPVATYSKSGAKATSPAKLDKTVFGLKVTSHSLLKDAYLTYLANGRSNNALAKRRGEVSGGGRKPWRQKGTGNARVGSSRTPLWRGGGVIFGPTGNANYSRQLNAKAKRQALRQALSLAAAEDKVKIIETFACPDGKVRTTIDLLKKISSGKCTLIVVPAKDDLVERATRNIYGVKAVHAKSLNIIDILNADTIVVSKKSLEIISEWLGGAN